MGQRSRKRRAAGGTPGRPPAMERGYARSRAKDDAVRRSLEPLAEGERPTAVTIAAIVAALIGIGNVVLVIAKVEVVEKQRVVGALAFGGIMFFAAFFMWRRAYWAVLGFQFLLGLSIVSASLSLLVASNVEAVIRSVVIILAAGTLFWFLIRAMARLQIPTRTR